MNNKLQPAAGEPGSGASEATHWSSIITLWIAAAMLGALTSLLVQAFMKGFGCLNGLTRGTFGWLPAPAGQITLEAA